MSSLLLKTLHARDLFRFADQCRVQKFSELESINMNLKKCIEGKNAHTLKHVVYNYSQNHVRPFFLGDRQSEALSSQLMLQRRTVYSIQQFD